MSILAQIAKGEGKTIEFKEKLPASDQLAKTIIAFKKRILLLLRYIKAR